MLRIFLIAISFFCFTVNAQNTVLAKVVEGKAFIGHTVGAGETLYGIARIYGIAPKDLASFNGLNPQKGLEKNIVLKIPVTPVTSSVKPCAGCATIKYAVQQHEGLYRINVNFGNMGTQNLIKLNNLTSDNLATGQELIIGYMKANGNEVSMVESSKTEQPQPNTLIDQQPAAVKETVAVVKQSPAVKSAPAKETAEPQKQDAVTKQSVNIPAEKKQDQQPVIKEEPVATASADGAFGAQFTNKSGQNKSGTAGIFKSISGWQDKKYYALMNSAEAGAIVRISNPATGKVIYAKVLGQMPYVKGSDALLLRISDAGAVALGASEDTMQVTVVY